MEALANPNARPFSTNQSQAANADLKIPGQSMWNPSVSQAALLASANSKSPVDLTEAIKDAYLAQLNAAEGSPAFNEFFGYGETTDDLSDHPNKKIYYNDGKSASTAFGSYQITVDTWREYAPKVGAVDISAENQKKVAWKLAEDNYFAKTGGRDLLSDLASGKEEAIGSAFVNNANRWSSLPGGRQPRTTVNDLVQGYIASVAQSQQAASMAQAQAPITTPSNLAKMSTPVAGVSDKYRAMASGSSIIGTNDSVANIASKAAANAKAAAQSASDAVAKQASAAWASNGSVASPGASFSPVASGSKAASASTAGSGLKATGSVSSGFASPSSSSISSPGSTFNAPSKSTSPVSAGSSGASGGAFASKPASSGSSASSTQKVTTSSGSTVTKSQRDAFGGY
jgi:muramidase (phage lysozyme)